VTAEFFAASNVLIVAGKGGVGKTTVCASLGIAAAQAGCDVLLIELEGHSSLSSLFGREDLSYDEVTVDTGTLAPNGRLRARQVKPDDALGDYMDRAGLGPLTSRLTTSGAMEVVATTAPGIRDLLTLGKIRQIEQAKAADLIIVDAPAAGHALTFLTAAAGLAESTSSGPVREQADLVLEMFADDARCQVVLVTLPEETPVSETIETAYNLEEDVGIKLAPVIVNGLWRPVDGLDAAVSGATKKAKDGLAVAAARYRMARIAEQQAEVDRLASELPLPQVHLPFLFNTQFAIAEIATLSQALTAQLEVAAP
jgi:anion-transporting  ArsA/GET3 family ATPase